MGKLPDAADVAHDVRGCVAGQGFEELAITLADAERTRVVTTVLETALRFVGADDGRSHLFGEPATERRVRTRLEAAYRESARAAATSSQRIALVDRANRVRPRTWR